jgi:MFS family permease
MAFVVFLDGTLISISLSRIASTLEIGNRYVWVTNSFWLAGTVVQPFCAQTADVVGRRKPMLMSIVFFFVGGAVCGFANSGATLIIGRTLQGVGGGGIMLLTEIILCDMLSLRERSRFLGILLSVTALGAIVEPPFGSVIAEKSWRWIFLLNLPISAGVFFTMGIFMRLRYKIPENWMVAVSQIDWIGTIILVGAITSVLIGLVSGSSNLPWSSPTVILTFPVSGLAWAGFHAYEASSYCVHPAVQAHLFRNRTSVAGYAITFIISMFTTWFAFCWPTYFQGILFMFPLKAGLSYLVYSAFLIPSAVIWGATLPVVLFNSSFSHYSYLIDDLKLREILDKGDAYQYINGSFIRSLPSPIKDQVLEVYARGLRLAWEVGIGFAITGLMLVLCERSLVMRTVIETEYGINT